MTDGIIQKVTKYNLKLINIANLTDRERKLIIARIKSLEQELIKEIDITISKNFHCCCVDTDDIRNSLIGGTKE